MKRVRVYSPGKKFKNPEAGTPILELDFSSDQSLAEAFEEIQYNLSEDLEKEVEGQVSHYLNKVLRIEADRQLRATWYERTIGGGSSSSYP